MMTWYSSVLYDIAAKTSKDVFQKITEDPIGFLAIPVGELLAIVLLGIVLIKLSTRSIDRVFAMRLIETPRATTLKKLIRSIVHYTLYFLLALLILIKLGFNPMPLLAGAGILGLAIGFGAQNLVKDFISGFFLILERQIEVGDRVKINGEIHGYVEEVGLRTTQIREYSESIHYIPNGMISQITNFTRDRMRGIVQITIPYESDLEKVEQILSQVCKIIFERHPEKLREEPTMFGVTSVDQYGVQYILQAPTFPEHFYAVEYDMRKEAIQQLRKNNIPFPFARNMFYSAEKNTPS